MLTKEGLEFLLRITDFFHGHWEDPEWGKRPLNQILLMLSTHMLAGGIADSALRQQIQEAAAKGIAETAQSLL